MKKSIILCALAILAIACQHKEEGGGQNPLDTRYFAPSVSFGSALYEVTPAGGGLDVELLLSRPATQAFSVGLVISSSLQEGVQYFIASSKVEIAPGDQKASLHVTLVDEEIWIESAWIEMTLLPGQRYTIDPQQNCSTKVSISKTINMPIFTLICPKEEELDVNPYLAPVLHFKLEGDQVPDSDREIRIESTNMELGKDYRIVGSETSGFIFPSGASKHGFDLQILKQDQPGTDKTLSFSIVPVARKYSVNPEQSGASIHLSDPVVNFKPIWKSQAPQNGTGYQIRQAFRTPAGEWDGNTTVDLGLSSEGSNYLRTYRNMYDHPSFGCMANSSVSQFLRMSDLFPNYVYPNATAILDYGNDQGHRQFSPADSLMRFVMDKGETDKGRIYLDHPQTFTAFIGSYAAWQDKSSGSNAWIKDSKATGGDIFASTHPALEGTISVTLVKLEGTFDFTNKDEPIFLTAWLKSDSDMFMKADEANGKDPANTYAATQEADGSWKLEYKLWPR